MSFEVAVLLNQARHQIGAFCCKGCKDIDDVTPGQDNFSSARLAGGFRLHCIADGHGPGGHWVSDQVVRILPYFLSSRDCRRMLCRGDVEEALLSAFERMQEYLISASEQDKVNLHVAGTTAVCILRQIHSPVVWVACVGDSRAIHLTGDGRVSFSTNDHKPSNPGERDRVVNSGCEVTVSPAGNGEELQKIVASSGPFQGKRPDEFDVICCKRSMTATCFREPGAFGIVKRAWFR